MANKKHLLILESGITKWNRWREHNPAIMPDLSYAELEEYDLTGANLREANLNGAELTGATLVNADLTNAQLIGACLNNTAMSKAVLNWTDASTAHFREADFTKANLKGSWFCEADMKSSILKDANLSFTDFLRANLTGADLRDADLSMSRLVSTNLNTADLRGCRIYGCSAWDIKGRIANQKDLIITPKRKSTITVDDIKVAQFIYLLLTNRNIRDIINTVAKKAVLILGRFTKRRKEVLSLIADHLRTNDLCPIIFDFNKPEEQDIIETVVTLAGICKFIIADVTDARVISDELRSFVPDFAIPVVPIFQPSKKEPEPYASLYTLYRKYHWVYEPVIYNNKSHLIDILFSDVIEPAENKRLELNLDK